jgi:two-component system, sensor histidine kinase and response regulator
LNNQFQTFDLNWALSHLGNDATLLSELAGLFIQESITLLPALRAAVNQRDARAVETAAHTLKGSASNFGAKDLCRDALALEQSGRDHNFIDIDQRLAAFERSAALFMDDLKALQA